MTSTPIRPPAPPSSPTSPLRLAGGTEGGPLLHQPPNHNAGPTSRPATAKIPFVPGYAILGDVDAVGDGVTRAAVGDRVSALTVFGGYAEYIYLAENQLIPTPPSLDPAEAVTLILNHIVACQTLHRSARVRAGKSAHHRRQRQSWRHPPTARQTRRSHHVRPGLLIGNLVLLAPELL